MDLPGRFPNVLVADSYDGARTPCVRYLNQLGFRVLEANGGDQALAHLQATTPQLILIENGLPNVSVSHIARQLSESAKTVPVIVMTSAPDGAADSMARLPFVSVLQKPFSLATMLEEIRRLLGTRRPPLADTL